MTLHEDERDNSTMKYLERLFDIILDRIVIFTDYFIIHKKITLSETFLFVFSICWAIWLGLFSAQSSGCHEFATVRITRSGCGIMIVTRPSEVVRPVIPAGEPFGFSG